MTETTPTPDSTPDSPTVPVPPAPGITSPASATEAPVNQQPVASEQKTKSRRTKGLLIGGGIVAALLLVGGGVAIGAEIADENDDDDRSSVAQGPRGDEDGSGQQGGKPAGPQTGVQGDDRDDDRDDDNRNDSANLTGATSADDLITVAEAARAVGEGEVISIDAEPNGSWDVQLETETGDETDVTIAADGSATVRSTEAADANDDVQTVFLTDQTIRDLVTAALAEQDGSIVDIDADDSATDPYDVSILTADAQLIELRFDADLALVGTETDD